MNYGGDFNLYINIFKNNFLSPCRDHGCDKNKEMESPL